jgi:hypothetical protein
MEIGYPVNFDISDYEDQFLWRYLDLHKLFDLVINRQLYFTRFDHFEDGVEGLSGYGLGLKYYNYTEPITEKNINKNFDLSTQKQIIEDDKYKRQEYLRVLTENQKTQFASCWFLGNRESIAMWKIYSRTDGVAIKINARQVIETVIPSANSYTNSDFKIMYFGKVDYKNIWPFDPKEIIDCKFTGLKKDKSYLHENEFRFVVAVSTQDKNKYENFKLPFAELSKLEIKIVTNPYMNNWQIGNLRILLSKFGLDSFIRQSEMAINK